MAKPDQWPFMWTAFLFHPSLSVCVCFTFYMYNAHIEYLCIVNACIINIYNAFIM